MSNIFKNRYKLLVIADSIKLVSGNSEGSKLILSEETKHNLRTIVAILQNSNKLVALASDVIDGTISNEEFNEKFASGIEEMTKVLQ